MALMVFGFFFIEAGGTAAISCWLFKLYGELIKDVAIHIIYVGFN